MLRDTTRELLARAYDIETRNAIRRDDGNMRLTTVASRAKLQISSAARHIGQEAIQMHGGIGITAEYPVGQYVSRLTAIGHTLGGKDDHLRYLAADLSGHDMITVTG